LHTFVAKPITRVKLSFFTTELFRALDPELPSALSTMDQHLDYILPRIIPYGEDLNEEPFWIGKRWKEIREDEGFHEAILHIFNPNSEYLLSLDGNVLRGSWKKLENYNTLLIEISGRSELFDLRYLDNDFMVMSKHGDQSRKGLRRYACYMHEPSARIGGREIDWRNAMEKLFFQARTNSIGIWYWVVLVFIIFLFLYLSFG